MANNVVPDLNVKNAIWTHYERNQ